MGKGENKGCLKGFKILKEVRLPANLYLGAQDEYDGADTDLDIDEWKKRGPYLGLSCQLPSRESSLTGL